MSKSNIDKKVNRYVKNLNRCISKDVFGDRFFLRQYQKTRYEGIEYYLYEMIDRVDPSRNKVIHHWFSRFEILTFHNLDMEINDFIVRSNFWKEYRK